jgi:hypothetical protein
MTVYSVIYEIMPDDIGVIDVRTIEITVDDSGDALTQINRAVRKVHVRAKVVEYSKNEDYIGEYFC